MDINTQFSHTVGLWLLYGLKLGNARSTTCFWWGWSPIDFLFWMLIWDVRSRANILEQGQTYIGRKFMSVLSLPTAVCFELRLMMLSQITRWLVSCNQPLRPPEFSCPHWGTPYHAWCTWYSWLKVHWWTVWVSKATPSHGKPMSEISNLERMKAYTLGGVKDFEEKAMLESTRCWPWDQG